MVQLEQITDLSNNYSENLLPVKSVINQDTVITKTSGDATYALESFSFFKTNRSIRYFYNSNIVSGDISSFNLGDSLKVSLEQDGNYLFSFALANFTIDLDYDVNIKVNIFLNSVLIETLEGTVNFLESEYLKYKTFSQVIPLSFGAMSEVDFSFEISVPIAPVVPYPDYQFLIDGFKFELDNKGLSLPTPYSLPVNYYKNPYSGWAYYVDSLATPTITIGTSYTQITIDALGANITDYLPLEIRGLSQLWSGSKITPISVGDDYDGRFDVTVTAKSGTPTLIELIIDISGTTAGTNKAFTGYIQTGGTIPYSQSIDLDYFSLATFLTNGGKLYAKVDSGSVTIGRRNIKITRKSKSF
jgi:hypothetical protein